MLLRENKSAAEGEEKDDRTNRQQLDEIAIPRPVSRGDGETHVLSSEDKTAIDLDQWPKAARQRGENQQGEQRTQPHRQQESGRHRSKTSPAIDQNRNAQSGENEERTF